MAETNAEPGDEHIRHIKAALNRPWLTQEEIDAATLEFERSKARDAVWIKIIIGLMVIYFGGMFYDIFARYLP